MIKKSIYIVTKPLQYINASNIEDDSIKTCLIVDEFSKSEKFIDKVKEYSNYWSEVLFFKKRKEALFYVLSNKKKYNKLYIDSDSGVTIRLLLILLLPLEINVYEEGFGNYRRELRGRQTFFDKIIYPIDRLMGKTYLGGFYGTKHIFLYHKLSFLNLVDKNPRQTIKLFRRSFFEHLLTLKEITFAFPNDLLDLVDGCDVVIYLTARKIDYAYRSKLKKLKGYKKILKPHPEFKVETNIEGDFDYVCESFLTAELLIAKVVENAKKIVILHHGDTTLLNLLGECNFVEVNVSKESKSVKTYNEIKYSILKNNN